MRKESIETLTFTGWKEGKRDTGQKEQVTKEQMLKREREITNGESMTESNKDRKLWRSMITHILKQHGT